MLFFDVEVFLRAGRLNNPKGIFSFKRYVAQRWEKVEKSSPNDALNFFCDELIVFDVSISVSSEGNLIRCLSHP